MSYMTNTNKSRVISYCRRLQFGGNCYMIVNEYTNVVSSYPDQARCTRYNILW